MTAHGWEEQRPGDPSRAGCRTCGAERDDTRGAPVYRLPTARKFTLIEPPCVPARGRQIPWGNPANARRALRACGSPIEGGPRKVARVERCPGCGYGSSVSEQVRFSADCLALEREGTDEDRAALRAAGDPGPPNC